MTRGELKSRVLKRLDESSAPAAVAAEEIADFLDEGQRLFALLTLCLERTGSVRLEPDTLWYNVTDQLEHFLLPLRCAQRPIVSGLSTWDRPTGDTVLWDELGGERGAQARVKPKRIADLDAIDPDWQGARNNTTQHYGVIGFDLLFIHPAPSSEGADLEFTYAASPAPMTDDIDTPAIPMESHPALIDFALCAARVKDGGAEFQRSRKFLDRFLDEAQRVADKVRARSRSLGYDIEPFELRSFDRSRLMEDMEKRSRRKPA